MLQSNIENIMYYLAVEDPEYIRRYERIISEGTQLRELVAALIYIDAAGRDTDEAISAIIGRDELNEAKNWAYANWAKFEPAISRIESMMMY